MHSLYTNEVTDCLKPAGISLASIHQLLKNNANPCVCSIALVSKIICLIISYRDFNRQVYFLWYFDILVFLQFLLPNTLNLISEQKKTTTKNRISKILKPKCLNKSVGKLTQQQFSYYMLKDIGWIQFENIHNTCLLVIHQRPWRTSKYLTLQRTLVEKTPPPAKMLRISVNLRP